MKYLVSGILISGLLISCGGSGEEDAVGEEESTVHTITANISGADGEFITLLTFERDLEKVVDSVMIANGEAILTTETKDLRQYVMMVGSSEVPIVLFLDQDSKDITVTGSVPGFGDNYQVSGSKPSEQIRSYINFLTPMMAQESLLTSQLRSSDPSDTIRIASLFGSLDSLSDIQRAYAVKEIESDSTSPAGWILLRELFPASGLQNFDSLDLRYFQMVANGMRSKYPNSDYPTYIENDLASVQAQIAALRNPGQESAGAAPDIALADRDGKELRLSSLRGKVVLIDFWASWCAPCRQENPNVVKAYNKYKDKGFTVYSVSLDEDRAKWLSAIEADNLSWPNHVSDLMGWRSPVVSQYGVEGIPATFLIDQEGQIIGRNLRGGQLEQKLLEVLG